MSRRTPYGALLLILLLLPTPALCMICAAEGCQMEMAEDCPMEKAPDCGDEMQEAAHGSHAAMMGSADAPMDHDMPMGHDCASRSRHGQTAGALGADCCATAAAREAEAIAPATPAPGGTPAAQQALSVAPDLASNADGVRRSLPPPAAPRALFTLYSSLLI